MKDLNSSSSEGARREEPTREARNVSFAGAVCPRCDHRFRIETRDLLPPWFPDPREVPTVPLWPIVGRLLGRKRSAILELARRDQLPIRVLRVGRTYRVSTLELLRMLAFENLEKDPETGRLEQQ
jgi:hypothetical protein